MRRFTPLLVLSLSLALGAYACSEWPAGSQSSPVAPSSVTGPGLDAGATTLATPSAATPSTAVVRFGRPDTGSPFPPPDEHDQSSHAKDNLTPRNVVIDVNGSVTFEVPPNVHQLAIYFPGKNADDVDTSPGSLVPGPANCPPAPLIDDDVDRMTVQTRPCFAPWSYTQTFTEPGKYLVICTFLPHFNVGMYGWVTVRDRQK